MYTKYYGLKERPFEISPDPKYFYMGENHREALAHLIYAVEAGKGFSVITGEVGTGKTTIVQILLKRMDGSVRTAHIFNPKMSAIDLLRYICSDLGVKIDPAISKGQVLAKLHQYLLECYTRSEKVVLMIDEAQALTPALLEEIRLLTNLETPRSKLMQVILLGQPELDKILMDYSYRQLKQRITVRFQLNRLNKYETGEYVRHRLRGAGSRNMDLFDKGAVNRIYEYSKGIPRIINTVCDNALLTGYATEKKIIDKTIIKDVICSLENQCSASNHYKKAMLAMVLIVFWGMVYYFLERF
jgi:general secretion pathway protein A